MQRKSLGLAVARTLGLLALQQACCHWTFAGGPYSASLHISAVGCRAKGLVSDDFTTNEEILATEVRVMAVVGDSVEGGPSQMQDWNEVMPTRDALAIARDKGVDLILVNEGTDPPLVKIASLGKYVYQENKRMKQAAFNAKTPKIKEVKLGYTIGEHDLQTKLKQCSKWLANSRQQVKITIVMKGRTKMFERQARELLERIRREAASYARVAGTDKGVQAINKDGRGDVFILLNHGPDRPLLKQLIEEAGGKKAMKAAAAAAAAAEDDDGGEDADGDDGGNDADRDIREIEMEIKAMREELLECGVKKAKLAEQEEMQELHGKLRQARAKLANS